VSVNDERSGRWERGGQQGVQYCRKERGRGEGRGISFVLLLPQADTTKERLTSRADIIGCWCCEMG
jgi:hypothetical protein